ncbi:Uncharacterised protein [Legionella busanensis]|uniref:Uncharacterized protein n=1 Tax=Legionella busanensis TaxID=190655 RepID=A0A378JP85_9GAMM|nr:Uncharacterised protein [Legionella busanensis]
MRPKLIDILWLYRITLHDNRSWCQLRFEKAERYYNLCLEKDLLGDWTIVISSGLRLKNGQKRLIAFNSYNNALEQLCNLTQNYLQQRNKLVYMVTNNLLLLTLLPSLNNYTYTNSSEITGKLNSTVSPRKSKNSANKLNKKVPKVDSPYQQLSLF